MRFESKAIIFQEAALSWSKYHSKDAFYGAYASPDSSVSANWQGLIAEDVHNVKKQKEGLPVLITHRHPLPNHNKEQTAQYPHLNSWCIMCVVLWRGMGIHFHLMHTSWWDLAYIHSTHVRAHICIPLCFKWLSLDERVVEAICVGELCPYSIGKWTHVPNWWSSYYPLWYSGLGIGWQPCSGLTRWFQGRLQDLSPLSPLHGHTGGTCHSFQRQRLWVAYTRNVWWPVFSSGRWQSWNTFQGVWH